MHTKRGKLILLFPVNPNTHDFFAAFRVTFLMPRVCLKPITWYIEMHHARTFFPCGVMTFSYYVMSIHNVSISPRGKLTALLVSHRTVSMAAVYQLKIKYYRNKFGEVLIMTDKKRGKLSP